MRNIIRRIKNAYQRLTRGYDDTVFWGMDDWARKTILPAVKEFCIDYFLNTPLEVKALNLKRGEIFGDMLILIKILDNESFEDMYEGKNLSAAMEYFGKNISYFWD